MGTEPPWKEASGEDDAMVPAVLPDPSPICPDLALLLPAGQAEPLVSLLYLTRASC